MDQAVAILPDLRRLATQPASPTEIMEILTPRFAIFPQPDRTDGEWAAWWADYTNALDDLPACALEAAMAEYVKMPDSEFFPKPGRIRELAKTVPNKAVQAYHIANTAVLQARLDAEPRQEYTPDPHAEEKRQADRQRVLDMVADYRVTMAKRAADRPKPAPKPSTSGPVDSAGLTERMREHIAQQSGSQ